jgi:feruloyl-CoA synthase
MTEPAPSQLAAPSRPAISGIPNRLRGFFSGRISENFKLSTGTFVTVGLVRTELISAMNGLIQDAVICGEGGEFVAALVWIHPSHGHRMAADGTHDTGLRAELSATLDGLAAAGGGSSQVVRRLLILSEPPDIDLGETTDKGYINQRLVRKHRAHLVSELVSSQPSARVICGSRSGAMVTAKPAMNSLMGR